MVVGMDGAHNAETMTETMTTVGTGDTTVETETIITAGTGDMTVDAEFLTITVGEIGRITEYLIPMTVGDVEVMIATDTLLGIRSGNVETGTCTVM